MTGDNRETLKTLGDNSIDAIVTDPPYGIDFLGKTWDANTGALETYAECLRVLKPGGFILAFSAARTYHHLAITLEQAGFEIRDQLMWLYASGFPKAQDIGKAIERREGKTRKRPDIERYAGSNEVIDGNFGSIHGKCPGCGKDIVEAKITGQKQACAVEGCEWMEVYKPANNEWAGWKTALKPAHEPICMARKPFKGSTIDNVLKNGLGALNIDATRVSYEGNKPKPATFKNGISYRQHTDELYGKDAEHTTERTQDYNDGGRFPSNVIGAVEGYQKYFYCPKVSRKERHMGFEKLPEPYDRRTEGLESAGIQGLQKINGEKNAKGGNNHPTVKPVELMKYLVKLVTPENSTVLDPFCGSGSTGMAAVELGHTFIGCELDENYVRIAETRITAWNTPEPSGTTYENLFEEKG